MVGFAEAPPDVVEAAARQLAVVADALRPHVGAMPGPPAGGIGPAVHRPSGVAPPFVVDVDGGDRAEGRVTFGRYYLGGNGAVYGGALPLLFDSILGLVSNRTGPRARTAYLHVDFRSITPVGEELRWTSALDRQEGRKRFARARLFNGEVVVAEAEALFVVLRAGQP